MKRCMYLFLLFPFMLLGEPAPSAEPIAIKETSAVVEPGWQILRFHVWNQFEDFNLRAFPCRWSLACFSQIHDSGTILLDLEPGREMEMALRVKIPDDIYDREYLLRLEFHDQSNTVFKHVIRLFPNDWERHFLLRLRKRQKDPSWQAKADIDAVKFEHRAFRFHVSSSTPIWFMLGREKNTRLIANGPFGVEWKDVSEENPHMIPLTLRDRQMERLQEGVELKSICKEIGTETVWGRLFGFCSPYGFIDWRFQPSAGGRSSFGLAFSIPSTLNSIAMFGDGPFGQQKTEPGLFQLNSAEIDTPILCRGIDLLAITNEQDTGLGLMMFDGDVLLFQQRQNWVVSILPRGQSEGQEIVFRLIPILQGEPSLVFGGLINQ